MSVRQNNFSSMSYKYIIWLVYVHINPVINSGVLRDKTMYDKLMHSPNYDKQISGNNFTINKIKPKDGFFKLVVSI